MTCEEFRSLLQGELDRIGDGVLPAALRDHADACKQCGAFFKSLTALHGALRHLPRVSPPAALMTALRQIDKPVYVPMKLSWGPDLRLAAAMVAPVLLPYIAEALSFTLLQQILELSILSLGVVLFGLHHALSARASGFCYINDPVVAISSLLKKGRRVAYIDIDAHHGDGVQDAFYTTDRVLTISIHETGTILFPGSGFENETWEGEGEGYSVNIPMPPTADDELFIYAFDEIVPPLINKFNPDIVVTQLGVDSLHGDPLAHLNYTTNGFCRVVRKIRDISPKWVVLGGGGYTIANVARAWSSSVSTFFRRSSLPTSTTPAAFSGRYLGHATSRSWLVAADLR